MDPPKWRGGKPFGTVTRRGDDRGWIVVFCKQKDGVITRITKTFGDNTFGGRDYAHKAALKWRKVESEARGFTKNQYRLIGQDTIEVKLGESCVMITDLSCLSIVNSWTWCHDGKGYARTGSTASDAKPMHVFHRLVVSCPEDLKVEHINGNTLDNRRANLRIVTPKGGGNQNNKRRK